MNNSSKSISGTIHPLKPGHRAFTLIEMLVVIAIIALLAALISPVVSKSLQKAKRTACMSNLRQVGLGIAMYRAEHDDRIPTQREGAGFTQDSFWLWEGGPTFLGMLYPDYVTHYQMFYCPGQDNTNDWFLNRGIKLFKNDQWGKQAILSTYVQRHVGWSPPLDLFANHAVAACCRHGNSLIPHAGKGPNVLYLDGSVRWLPGNEANNYRPFDQSTRDFWTAADKN